MLGIHLRTRECYTPGYTSGCPRSVTHPGIPQGWGLKTVTHLGVPQGWEVKTVTHLGVPQGWEERVMRHRESSPHHPFHCWTRITHPSVRHKFYTFSQLWGADRAQDRGYGQPCVRWLFPFHCWFSLCAPCFTPFYTFLHPWAEVALNHVYTCLSWPECERINPGITGETVRIVLFTRV